MGPGPLGQPWAAPWATLQDPQEFLIATYGLFFIGNCYEELSMKDSALYYYKAYLPYAPDTVVSSRVEQFIKKLEEDLNT